MTEKKSVLASFSQSYAQAISAVAKDPRIYLPFMIFAIVEMVTLFLLFLAPRMPFRVVMGPVISSLWGEQYLHYPYNFVLLPKLAGFSRMVLSVLAGSLLTGISLAYLYKKPIGAAIKKYLHLLLIVFLLTVLFYYCNKIFGKLLLKYFTSGHTKLLFIGARMWLGPINLFIVQFMAVVLQALFVYAIPVVMLSEKKFFGAILESVGMFFTNFRLTILFVLIPMMLTVPLLALNYNGSYFMSIFCPEFVLWLGFLAIIINSLLIDPMITLTTAVFYAENRGK